MKNSLGLTLLEVMVSLFILTMTLLAMSSMQLTALNTSYYAFYKTIALIQIASLDNQLKAHPKNHIILLKNWQEESKLILPNGESDIRQLQTSIKVSLKWNNHNCKTKMGWNECLEKRILL